jgi:hypothetical protein
MQKAFLHPALPDQDVGEGMLRPRISRFDGERTPGTGLGVAEVVAQLAGERRHRKEIRIVRVQGLEAVHMRAETCTHELLAEHVIEKLRELRAEEVARPLDGDRLQGLERPQVVIRMPLRERPVERALAHVHGQRFTLAQMRGGVRACVLGLPIEPERGGVELNDGRRGPALRGLEDGLDTLIESQQPRGEVVSRRNGGSIVRADVEPARVLHPRTINRPCAPMQNARRQQPRRRTICGRSVVFHRVQR